MFSWRNKKNIMWIPPLICSYVWSVIWKDNWSITLLAVMWENVPSDLCTQRRLKSACTSAQSDQSLHFHREEIFHPCLPKVCPVKILIRLCECVGWSESLLGTHVRRYIFSHCSLFVVHICIVSDKRVIQMNICLFFCILKFYSSDVLMFLWVITIYVSVEKISTLVLLNPDMSCLCKQCRSRSVGFWRSQLIWISTVCHLVCEFVSTIWIK